MNKDFDIIKKNEYLEKRNKKIHELLSIIEHQNERIEQLNEKFEQYISSQEQNQQPISEIKDVFNSINIAQISNLENPQPQYEIEKNDKPLDQTKTEKLIEVEDEERLYLKPKQQAEENPQIQQEQNQKPINMMAAMMPIETIDNTVIEEEKDTKQNISEQILKSVEQQESLSDQRTNKSIQSPLEDGNKETAEIEKKEEIQAVEQQESIELNEKGKSKRKPKRKTNLMALIGVVLVILSFFLIKVTYENIGNIYLTLGQYEFNALIGGIIITFIAAILCKMLGHNLFQRIVKYCGFIAIYIGAFLILNCHWGLLSLWGLPVEVIDGNFHSTALNNLNDVPQIQKYFGYLVQFKNSIPLPNVSEGFISCINATNNLWFGKMQWYFSIPLSIGVWIVAVLGLLFLAFVSFFIPLTIPLLAIMLIKELFNFIFRIRM